MNTDPKRIACKLVYLLKRAMDEWLNTRLCSGDQACFNNSHLPLLMSIGTSGITNNALAEKLNVTKQASSKIVKELEALNMIRSEKCSTDARAVMLYLTADGEKFYHHIAKQIFGLEDQYKKLVGTRNYEIAIDVMMKMIAFHEEQNGRSSMICS